MGCSRAALSPTPSAACLVYEMAPTSADLVDQWGINQHQLRKKSILSRNIRRLIRIITYNSHFNIFNNWFQTSSPNLVAALQLSPLHHSHIYVAEGLSRPLPLPGTKDMSTVVRPGRRCTLLISSQERQHP